MDRQNGRVSASSPDPVMCKSSLKMFSAATAKQIVVSKWPKYKYIYTKFVRTARIYIEGAAAEYADWDLTPQAVALLERAAGLVRIFGFLHLPMQRK